MQRNLLLLAISLFSSACAHQGTTRNEVSSRETSAVSVAPGEVDLSAYRRLDLEAFLAPTSNHLEVVPGASVLRRKSTRDVYSYVTLPDLNVVAEVASGCLPTADAELFECGDAVRDRAGSNVVVEPRTNPYGYLTRAVVDGGRWVAFRPNAWTVFDRSGPLGAVTPPRASELVGRRLVVEQRFVKYQGSEDALVLDTETLQMTPVVHGTPYMPAAGGALRGEGVLRSVRGELTTWSTSEQGGAAVDEVRHGTRTWRCQRAFAWRPCLQVEASQRGEVLVMQRDLSDGLELWRTDGTRFGALRGLHPTTTVTLSRDGRFLMMPVNGGVEVAELDTLRPTLLLAGHRARPRFDTLPGHDRLLSCDGAGMAVLWDRERPAPIRHLGFPGCEGLAFARDGVRFIAGRTVFEGDGVASMTLSSAKATALALDGAEVYVLDIVEGPTFEDRRIELRAHEVEAPTSPRWRVTLPQRRLLDPGLAVVADRSGSSHLVVGTGDAVMVVDPKDGRVARILPTHSPSAPMAMWDRSGVSLAIGTAGNRVQLVAFAADGWQRRTVARWELANNILPLHVPIEGPDAGWLIPTDSALQLHAGSSMKTASMPAHAGGGAVAAVPLDTTRWLVGMGEGAIHVVEFEPR